jgi:hypothetical protein
VKAFHWFAVGWLLAVAGSAIVAVASGFYHWSVVVRTAVSLGVMPIVTATITIKVSRWLRHYQERHFSQD